MNAAKRDANSEGFVLSKNKEIAEATLKIRRETKESAKTNHVPQYISIRVLIDPVLHRVGQFVMNYSLSNFRVSYVARFPCNRIDQLIIFIFLTDLTMPMFVFCAFKIHLTS